MLAALRQNDGVMKQLLRQFRSFTRVYHASLNQADVAISRAYIAVKLWVLAIKLIASSGKEVISQSVGSTDFENLTTAMVWSELWPPLEAVVTSLEQHGSSSNLMVSLSYNFNAI